MQSVLFGASFSGIILLVTERWSYNHLEEPQIYRKEVLTMKHLNDLIVKIADAATSKVATTVFQKLMKGLVEFLSLLVGRRRTFSEQKKVAPEILVTLIAILSVSFEAFFLGVWFQNIVLTQLGVGWILSTAFTYTGNHLGQQMGKYNLFGVGLSLDSPVALLRWWCIQMTIAILLPYIVYAARNWFAVVSEAVKIAGNRRILYFRKI